MSGLMCWIEEEFEFFYFQVAFWNAADSMFCIELWFFVWSLGFMHWIKGNQSELSASPSLSRLCVSNDRRVGRRINGEKQTKNMQWFTWKTEIFFCSFFCLITFGESVFSVFLSGYAFNFSAYYWLIFCFLLYKFLIWIVRWAREVSYYIQIDIHYF